MEWPRADLGVGGVLGWEALGAPSPTSRLSSFSMQGQRERH